MKKPKTNEDISPFSKCSVSFFIKLINGITPEDELIDIYNSYSNLAGNKKDKNGVYLLLYTCQYNIYNSFAIILIENYPAAISETNWDSYRNPIHAVVDSGRIDIMPLVLEYSSSFVNDCTSIGRQSLTPLQYIINKEGNDNFDKYAFLQLFLKNAKVLVNAVNADNETALYTACKTRDIQTIELLFKRPDIDPSQSTELNTNAFFSIFRNNDDSATLGLDDIEMVDYEANEIYHEIMSRNSLMIIIKLFVRRFPLILDQVVKTSSHNALHVAVMNNCYYVIPFLLSIMGKKSINNINNKGRTPLHMACNHDRYLKLTTFLLCQPSVCINIKDKKGLTPFHSACNNKSINTIRFLINYPGVDINTVDCMGNTTLHSAIDDSHLHWAYSDIVHVNQELLIGLLLGTDTNIHMNLKILKKNMYGMSALNMALSYSNSREEEDMDDDESGENELSIKALKVDHWEKVLMVLVHFLHKGRFDYYQFLMKYYIGSCKNIENKH